jgi:hypothetical protein
MKHYIFVVILLFLGLIHVQQIFGSTYIAVDDDNKTGVENGSDLNPYSTISAAVSAAASGTSIRIAQGNYNESIVIQDKTLMLSGGYPGKSSYTDGTAGDFSLSDHGTYVSRLTGQKDTTVIEFVGTISGSKVTGLTISSGRQGILIDAWPIASHITISNNIIENNGIASQADYGGGINISGTDIIISDNVIRNNMAEKGAGAAFNAENILFDNNQVSGNTATSDHAGGLYFSGSGTISCNLISNNTIGTYVGYGWGGGVLLLPGQTTDPFVFSNNIVSSNHAVSAGGGVFVDEGGNAVLKNNLIINNTVEDSGGAGILVDGAMENEPEDPRSRAEIINCTVVNNTGGNIWGNGVFVTYSDAIVENCIFYDNEDDFCTAEDGSLVVAYTLSQENWDGTGNITGDPLFAGSSDYHLKSKAGRWDAQTAQWVVDLQTSPCIDAGNPDSIYSSEPSGNGSRINIGVYGNTAEASKSNPAATTLVAPSGNIMDSPVDLYGIWISTLPGISSESTILIMKKCLANGIPLTKPALAVIVRSHLQTSYQTAAIPGGSNSGMITAPTGAKA